MRATIRPGGLYTCVVTRLDPARPALLAIALLLAGFVLLGCDPRQRGVRPDDDDDGFSVDDDDSASSDDDDVAPDDDDGVPDDDDVAPDDDDVVVDDDDYTPPEGTTTVITFESQSYEFMVVDPVTGQGTPLLTIDPMEIVCSSVFNRSGTLYVSAGGKLMTFDACSGQLSLIGYFPGDLPVCGIGTNDLSSLYGINDQTDELILISTIDASITPVGPLGVDFGPHGMSWDPSTETFIALNGEDNTLYSIDPDTGAATLIAPLIGFSFDGVGVELDPVGGQLYGCSGTEFVSIDTDTGQVTVVGQIHDGACNNLGATHLDIPCISD